MSPYTTSSKSKTFQKETDYDDLMDFITGQIEIEHRELAPSYGTESATVKIETRHKYIITITKIEEKAL